MPLVDMARSVGILGLLGFAKYLHCIDALQLSNTVSSFEWQLVLEVPGLRVLKHYK
jgi:hypothetical protein